MAKGFVPLRSMDIQKIFGTTSQNFETIALEVFAHQYHQNAVYQEFCSLLGRTPDTVAHLEGIPYLPIEFFKSHKLVTSPKPEEIIFTSSGTTQSQTSNHYVADLSVYQQSFLEGFEHFYGPVEHFCVLGLLPAYLERQGSSLVYMVDDFIKRSKYPESGFYLHDLEALAAQLQALEKAAIPTVLIGVSFALLDFADQFPMPLKHTILMETGGMKGKRKEMVRSELHQILKEAFGLPHIHSEYGMTELLSQAYSKGNGLFGTPPWMQISIRDTEDPLSLQAVGKTGGINIIDLANVHSCSFLATQDLGKQYADGSFEILGRFDHSDVRGCNLMVL